MRVTRANFGRWVSPHFTTEGVALWTGTETMMLEHGLLRPALDSSAVGVAAETGPFEIADFGERNRLSWASGACSIAVGRFAFWGQRFIAWIKDTTLTVIDATRPVVLTLKVAGLFEGYSSYREFRSHAGSLWLEGDDGVMTSIEHAELEALFDRAAGALQVLVRETYPNHKPDANRPAEIVGHSKTSVTLKTREEKEYLQVIIHVPWFEGAVTGTRVTLREEITHSSYRRLELADGRSIELNEKPIMSRNLTAHLAIEQAVDPAGGPIVVEDPQSRQADLDRLFEALVDNPEDAATRDILIDLLEDSGEPYAGLLHELVAGETDEAKRRAALGPLSNFLIKQHYAGGLWHTATLSAKAPPDPIIVDAVITDQRWGLFHTLRIGDGAFAVYAKIVSSPRAVGLRHVDVPNARILTALIAGKRTQLTAISNVKFATKAVIEGLTDPTFDRVVDLHTETSDETLAMQLEYFIRDEAGFFARAPRHLILTDRHGHEDQLAKWVTAAWPRLPVAAVTCGALKLQR